MATKISWHTETRKVDDLVPYDKNPRTLSEKQRKDLEASITKFSLAEIPAINTDNTIVAGHARLKVMQLLGRGQEEIDVGMDLKEYAIFIISQEFTKDSDQLRAFVKDVKEKLEDVLDKDWQDSTKRDVFIKDVKQTLQELILRDYKGIVENKDFSKFLNRLVDVITKKF